ncbi:hypothetical protein GCM10010975_33050 [Comamonas phosphati]|nr:hypothetical protein GCM10010975_33050 [Comamonas phosphati]
MDLGSGAEEVLLISVILGTACETGVNQAGHTGQGPPRSEGVAPSRATREGEGAKRLRGVFAHLLPIRPSGRHTRMTAMSR